MWPVYTVEGGEPGIVSEQTAVGRRGDEWWAGLPDSSALLRLYHHIIQPAHHTMGVDWVGSNRLSILDWINSTKISKNLLELKAIQMWIDLVVLFC